MEEIARHEFWELESLLSEIEKTTGELDIIRDGQSTLYKRGFKKWMRSIVKDGVEVYFADPSLILRYLR